MRTTSVKILFGLLLFSPIRLMAAVEKAEQQKQVLSQPVVSGVDLAEMTVGLLAVLGIIFMLAWIIKKYGQFQVSANGSLKILGGMSLGTRERIVLVQVGNSQLLLGVAPGRVQTLHKLEGEEQVSRELPEKNVTFAERMFNAMKQRQEN